MNKKVDYIFVDDDELGFKQLLRRVDYEGESYYKREWHPFSGALSYFPDPTPGEFITEEKAKEIMKIIDEEEEMLDKEE